MSGLSQILRELVDENDQLAANTLAASSPKK